MEILYDFDILVELLIVETTITLLSFLFINLANGKIIKVIKEGNKHVKLHRKCVKWFKNDSSKKTKLFFRLDT